MAEFCTCGSIKIGGNCTNKNCINRENVKSTSSKSAGKSATRSAAKSQPKSAKTRKSSKVVTYNLYDIEEKEENID